MASRSQDDWATSATSPVSDSSSSGEFVGQGHFDSRPAGVVTTDFAAFSTPNGQVHKETTADCTEVGHEADDLNDDVNAQGVYLTAALKVDDLGPIIPQRTLNGQNEYFRLTPTATPAPTMLFVLASGIFVLAFRSTRLRGQGRATPA